MRHRGRTLVVTSVLLLLVSCGGGESAGRGNAAVSASIGSCPIITGIEALPAEVVVGHELQLRAVLSDSEARLVWHSPAGRFRRRTARTTWFRCVQPGEVEVVLHAIGGGRCRDRASAVITCSASLVCGNGTLDEGEQCDDGNLNPADGCSPGCMPEPPGEGGSAGVGSGS